MPLKRTYSTSTTVVPAAYQQTKKRRHPPKRARRVYPRNGTVGMPRPFPVRTIAKLKYATIVPLLSSLTPIANYLFSCNSIYDPDTTGTGHQPYGHDTYATIYNQYTVLYSIITVQVSMGNSANSYTWGVGIEDANIGTVNTVDTWMERPTYKSNLQTARDAYNSQVIRLKWDRMKRFPHEDVYRGLSAPFGSSPTESEFFNVIIQSPSATGALGQFYATVTIDYFCELYEPKDLGSS